MHIRLPLITLAVLALWAGGALDAQVGNPIAANPIPAPVTKRGLTVEIRDVVRLPETRGLRPAEQDVVPAGWARVSFVRDLPDGRRFVNDSRGRLYLLDRNNQASVYADVAAVFPFAVYNRLESGFIGFDFHPEFARNGLFYTVHGERAPGNPATPNFIPPGFTQADVTYHNVITEWRATNPAANTFDGTRRELLRVAHVVNNLTSPVWRCRIQPDVETWRPRLRPALHERERSGVQQRRGPECDQSGPDPAPRYGDWRCSAHRSAQPFRVWRDERARGLHHSGDQQVRRRWRSEDPRRDLRVRIPERS